VSMMAMGVRERNAGPLTRFRAAEVTIDPVDARGSVCGESHPASERPGRLVGFDEGECGAPPQAVEICWGNDSRVACSARR